MEQKPKEIILMECIVLGAIAIYFVALSYDVVRRRNAMPCGPIILDGRIINEKTEAIGKPVKVEGR